MYSAGKKQRTQSQHDRAESELQARTQTLGGVQPQAFDMMDPTLSMPNQQLPQYAFAYHQAMGMPLLDPALFSAGMPQMSFPRQFPQFMLDSSLGDPSMGVPLSNPSSNSSFPSVPPQFMMPHDPMQQASTPNLPPFPASTSNLDVPPIVNGGFHTTPAAQKVLTKHQHKMERPPFTFAALAAQAIVSCNPDQCATLNEIYDYIMTTYPFFKNESGNGLNLKSWQNSVRHFLSLKPVFVKITRHQRSQQTGMTSSPGKRGSGKGGCWTLDPNLSKTFDGANFVKETKDAASSSNQEDDDAPGEVEQVDNSIPTPLQPSSNQMFLPIPLPAQNPAQSQPQIQQPQPASASAGDGDKKPATRSKKSTEAGQHGLDIMARICSSIRDEDGPEGEQQQKQQQQQQKA